MLNMQPAYSKHIKQWEEYLTILKVKALTKSVIYHGHSYKDISFSVYSMMHQSFAAVCPNTHYSYLTDSPSKMQALCGRIYILTNSARNTDDLQTVYTIQVPRQFNINFSLADFSEDFNHRLYSGCGFNDILISSEKERWATFCGRPFPQTVIVGDRTAHVQSYHQPREDESPTVRLTVYFEVIPRQIGIHAEEHHVLFSQLRDFYPSGVISYMAGNLSDSLYNLKVYKLCEDCRSEKVLTLERLQPLHKRYPAVKANAPQGFSIFGHIEVYKDLSPSHTIVDPEIVAFSSTERISMHEQIHQHLHSLLLGDDLDYHYANMYRLLVSRPRNLLRPMYGKLVHTSETGPSLVEVRVWTIHGPQFVDGQLEFGQLFLEIQRENCPTEDTVLVYDGPPAGMLTSYGLTSPFAVLYNGACADMTDVVKSSLGDLTISWIHHKADDGDIGFAYKQQPALCSEISCTHTDVSVIGLEKTLIFEQTNKPSFQVFRFEARSEGNVQLRFQIHTAAFTHSIEGCLYSALWLFEDSLRGAFCTQIDLMLLNSSTLQTKGILFSRLAQLVIKSYPQTVRIKFMISFISTSCTGLVNPCINPYFAGTVPLGRCFQLSGTNLISISGSLARDCCAVVTYLENSLILPLICSFHIYQSSPGSHLFRVDHTEFTAPFKFACCSYSFLDAALHIRSNVEKRREECSHETNSLKNRTFLTTHIAVHVVRNLNPGGCSSILAIAGEQSKICMDLELPSKVLRVNLGFDNRLSLSYSCINTGVLLHVHPIIHITVDHSVVTFDVELEYYFKIQGSIDIRKEVFTFYGAMTESREWGMSLRGLYNEFYRFIDSKKSRSWKKLHSAKLTLHSSFVLQFRMKRTHPIKSDEFYIMYWMPSDLCPESAYRFLSRCYQIVATGNFSWSEAYQTCKREGMNMLSLNSEQEWLALAEFLFEMLLDVATVFLGLRRVNVSDSIS